MEPNEGSVTSLVPEVPAVLVVAPAVVTVATGGGVAGGTLGAGVGAAVGMAVAGPPGAAVGYLVGIVLGSAGGATGVGFLGHRVGRTISGWREG